MLDSKTVVRLRAASGRSLAAVLALNLSLASAPLLAAAPVAPNPPDILDESQIFEDTAALAEMPGTLRAPAPSLTFSISGGRQTFASQALFAWPLWKHYVSTGLILEYQELRASEIFDRYVLTEIPLRLALLPSYRLNPFFAVGVGYERWNETEHGRSDWIKAVRTVGADLRFTDHLLLTIAAKRNFWLASSPRSQQSTHPLGRTTSVGLYFGVKI